MSKQVKRISELEQLLKAEHDSYHRACERELEFATKAKELEAQLAEHEIKHKELHESWENMKEYSDRQTGHIRAQEIELAEHEKFSEGVFLIMSSTGKPPTCDAHPDNDNFDCGYETLHSVLMGRLKRIKPIHLPEAKPEGEVKSE